VVLLLMMAMVLLFIVPVYQVIQYRNRDIPDKKVHLTENERNGTKNKKSGSGSTNGPTRENSSIASAKKTKTTGSSINSKKQDNDKAVSNNSGLWVIIYLLIPLILFLCAAVAYFLWKGKRPRKNKYRKT
jgi:cytoskeletal protein RodZ